MVNKVVVAKEVYHRIKIKTLDESQGDEADFDFVDFVAVSHPRFTRESFRITPRDHSSARNLNFPSESWVIRLPEFAERAF